MSAITVVAALWGLGACRDPEPEQTDGQLTDPGPEATADAGQPVRGLVGEVLTLDGSASIGSTFSWTLSDARQLDGPVVELSFDAPGHYTAVLEVADALGRIDTDSISITVTWPLAAVPPAAGSAVAASEDGRTLFVTLADFDAVAEVDRVARTVRRWIPTCDEPRSVAASGETLWIACAGDDVVARVTGEDDQRIALPWGARPFSVVARPDRGDVLVTLQGLGALAVLRADPVALDRIVPALPDVRGLAVSGDRVLLTRYRSPDAEGEALLLDADLEGAERLSLAIDPGPDSDTNARGLPNLLQRPVVRPDGRVAAIGGSKANIERGLFREGRPLTFETAARADLRQIALVPDEGPVGSELEAAVFDDRDLVVAAAYTPDGGWLLALHTGMETLDVLDAYTMTRAGAAQGTGSGPEAIWVSPDGAEAWVYAALSRTLAVFDLSAIAVPGQIATVDLLPPSGEVLDPVVLRGRILFGRSVDPRMSTGGYLSCASCHPEGDHDGRTWDFTDRGEGLRNTISLRGRRGEAPIHWSANFDELQDFENDIRNGQGGDGFLTDEDFAATEDPLGVPKAGLSDDLDALAAYIESLDTPYRSPLRGPDGQQSAEAAVGAALFADPAVGCTECHPLPGTTDSAWLAEGVPLLHDVGTLGPGSGSRRGEPLTGLDTPPLHSLAATAPYLHDGSAATVREVLVDRNPDDRHGAVSHLDEAQLDALIRYVLELE